MRVIAKFREPRQIEFRLERRVQREGRSLGYDPYEERRVAVVTPLPSVIDVSDGFLAGADWPRVVFSPEEWRDGVGSLEDLGYIRVRRRNPGITRYVRGRWLWLIHKVLPL